MSNYEHGRILAVNETRLGSELVSAHAAGVTSLTVEDPVDFDEDGGWLKIGDQVIEYTTYDDDTGEITLLTPLAAAADDGDRVFLWDPLYGVITTEKTAEVELDGDDDNTDPLEASIAHHLIDKTPEGIRGTRGESVLLELDGDEWRVVDILGLATAPQVNETQNLLFWQDVFELVGGAEELRLTHLPVENSEHLYWNGVYQRQGGVWSRTGQNITVTGVPYSPREGDVVVVEYAYLEGAAIEAPSVPMDPGPSVSLVQTGGVQTVDFSNTTAEVLGDPMTCWTDGSAATGAKLQSYWRNNGDPDTGSYATADFELSTRPVPVTDDAEFWVYFEVVGQAEPFMWTVSRGATDQDIRFRAHVYPGWGRLEPLANSAGDVPTPSQLLSHLNSLNTNTLYAQAYSPVGSYDPAESVHVDWTITEARIEVRYPEGTVISS